MPTYDYACPACGHRFERFESIHDGGSKSCTKCGKKKARRMLGMGAGLIFKGSGFYATDYARKGKGGSESETGGSKDPEKKDSDKNKPAAQGEKNKVEKAEKVEKVQNVGKVEKVEKKAEKEPKK